MDLISKSDLIDYFYYGVDDQPILGTPQLDAEVIDVIENLPIDRVRVFESTKIGRWVGIGYDGYADGHPVYNEWECSNCGHEIGTEHTPPYCEMCGCKMEDEGINEL